ncbi:acyltransferase family protein [Ruegeria sp. SCSIO 43209]|uniref:acyltransferase family protein n=1 Tax=Ruegeria sp. SCSIO 43209 TaxID=2793010 RepID=UPI0021028F70|nr:acyltransferase family protein [Ruegeria sp. SCSIO 43209]
MTVSSSDYRREIDGLRALAILPVVFFHFSLPGLGGGFVGVDIFFVISGFLIGGLLWSELTQTGGIRWDQFFLRRIRRLAPAYFTMAISCLVVGWFVLLPFEFQELGKELISSTVYLSNVYFYLSAGYFDTAADEKLLLHTWSLAVEEQFYIILPLFLLLLRRAQKWLPAILISLGLVSLVACIGFTSLSQPAAFYLFPFRAWELLAGVCLAIFGHRYGWRWSIHPLVSWIGLLLIVGSVTLIPSDESFPGIWPLAPVLGAVLIIGNGKHDNPVNWALNHPVLVFIGLISYSLYLWHWPVIVLAQYYSGEELSLLVRVMLIGVSVILAWASLRFIEKPVRFGNLKPQALLGGAAGASIITLGGGAVIYLGDGIVERFPHDVRTHIEASQDFRWDTPTCRLSESYAFPGSTVCHIGPEGDPEVLIWGDSHLVALSAGIEAAARSAGVPTLVVWQLGCAPVFGIGKDESFQPELEDRKCETANTSLQKGLEELPDLKAVLLVSRWAYHVEGKGVGLDEGTTTKLFPSIGGLSGDDQPQLFAKALHFTVDELENKSDRVFVLEHPPEISNYLSYFLARDAALRGMDDSELMARTLVQSKDLKQRMYNTNRALEPVLRRPNVTLLETWPEFCTGDICSAMKDGRAAYHDNNHVTITTALGLQHLFSPVFE